jgi:hypothetical protein
MQARRPAIGAAPSQRPGENPVAKGQQTLIRLLGDTLVGSIGRVDPHLALSIRERPPFAGSGLWGNRSLCGKGNYYGKAAIMVTTEPVLPSAEPVSRSPAAERMRRHRQRRRDGMRCLIVELRETEIEVLVRRGYLNKETRNNERAIIEALYAHLENTLV